MNWVETYGQIVLQRHEGSRELASALLDSVRMLVQRWQRARAQDREVFRITQELAGRSDRQLADLGFSRADIPAIARGI
jgi:uncharacterized protein YjiS (DUF1127 family)